jgi:hypothetical protein
LVTTNSTIRLTGVMYVKLYPQPEEPKPSTDAHDYEWIDATGEGAGE